ncbi:MAG: OmpA family protein [Planctomycetes bacterium]|jgi:chemotaxis protein MotB|nr:OmpA family protein [Planctomycetota bacterium]
MKHSIAVAGFAVVLSLLGAACASTDWEARYIEMEGQARLLEEQNEALRRSIAENDASVEGARRELQQTQQTIDLLARELKGVKDQPPVVVAAASDPAMEEDLARLRGKYGDVNLTPDGNIEITLNSDITFSSGSRNLTTEGKRILDSVAAELKGEFAENSIRVIGHTDSDPIKKSGFADNWELGAERALEVTRYFASKHAIEPARLVAASRGETSPVADNASKDGKRKNRRVEIVVVIPKKGTGGETVGR